MVLGALEYRKPLLAMSKEYLRAEYGFSGRDDNGIGPFSMQTWLLYMAKAGSWGDRMCLTALSLMCNATVTILDISRLDEERLRHNNSLETVDFVFLYNGRDHYSPACECGV